MRLRIVGLSLAALLMAVGAPATGQSTGERAMQQRPRVGVGMVPYMNGGDDAEKSLHMVVGQHPRISTMYNPDNAKELFEILKKIKRSGKAVDFLMIGGHGSKAEPRIEMRNGDLELANVNLPSLRNGLA